MRNGAVRHFPASRAMEHAPAVWELEGPIISGPNTSNILINAICIPSFSFLQLIVQRLSMSAIHVRIPVFESGELTSA